MNKEIETLLSDAPFLNTQSNTRLVTRMPP